MAPGALQIDLRLRRGEAGGVDDEPQGPVPQLLVAGLQIHHQIAVDLAQLDHGAGGEHVEHHLLGGARLHAGGAGDDLRAHQRGDGHVAQPLQLRPGVGAHPDGDAPPLLCPPESGKHIGGAAAGGDAHHRVVRTHLQTVHQGDAVGLAVLAALHRVAQGHVSAGDVALDHVRVHAEGGHALGGVQHAQPPRGARPQVDEPSAPPEAAVDQVHRLGNVMLLGPHRPRHQGVLMVDEGHHLLGGTGVDALCLRVDPFGGQTGQIVVHGNTSNSVPSQTIPSPPGCQQDFTLLPKTETKFSNL